MFGNICAYIILKLFKVESSTGGPGWNGATSILFIVLGCASSPPNSLLAVSIFGSVILFGAKPARDANREEIVMRREPKNVLTEVATVLRMVVQPRMLLLVPLFLCLGFQSIFVNSMYNRQIDDKSSIALFMIVYTVCEVFCGYVHGWCIDRLGLFPMLLVYIALGSLALLLAYFANRWQNMTFLLLYALFSVTDSGFQTFVRSPVAAHA